MHRLLVVDYLQPLSSDAVQMWTGVMRDPGQSSENMVVVEVSYLGGSGRLGPMLRCAEPPTELLVKGQVGQRGGSLAGGRWQGVGALFRVSMCIIMVHVLKATS